MQHKGEVVAIDGKTVRGSYDKQSKENAIHMLSAWANKDRIKIKANEADYVLAVKGNQRHLHQSIKDFFTICHDDGFSNTYHQFHEEVDAAHG